jgi:hypothetical protein
MKRKITLSLVTLGCLLATTNVSALTRVYLKLASDTQSWNNVTQDASNIVKTIGIGGNYANFTDINFTASTSTGLNLATNDEIWIAKGSYPFTKMLKDSINGVGVKLYGGFAGTEISVSQRAKSDLDRNGMVEPWEFTNTTKFVGLGNDFSTPQTFRMMILSTGNTIDGITISDVYYTNTGSTTYAGGGEIQTGALIRNSIIQNISTVSVSNVGTNGGGLYINRGGVDGCLIENCITDILSSGNTSGAYGGGISLNGAGNDNTSTCTGYVVNSIVRNCTAGSVAGANKSLGGGIYANVGARVENCVIYNNSAICNGGTSQGGGILGNGSGDAFLKGIYFVNLTVVNNFSYNYPSFFPASNYASAYNCIVWQNGNIGTAAAPAYTGSSIRISATTGITGYPYLDYIFYNTDATTPIVNKDNNKANPFTAYTAKVVLSGADNSAYPAFFRPTTFVGSSYAPADITSIRQANWTLTASSPLIDKGVSTPTNTVTTALISPSPYVSGNAFDFSKTDLGGLSRGNQYQLGAYQFTPDKYTSTKSIIKTKLNVSHKNGLLQISGLEGSVNVKVFSVSGKIISSSSITAASTGIQLPQHGVYLVAVKWNQETEVHKIVF